MSVTAVHRTVITVSGTLFVMIARNQVISFREEAAADRHRSGGAIPATGRIVAPDFAGQLTHLPTRGLDSPHIGSAWATDKRCLRFKQRPIRGPRVTLSLATRVVSYLPKRLIGEHALGGFARKSAVRHLRTACLLNGERARINKARLSGLRRLPLVGTCVSLPGGRVCDASAQHTRARVAVAPGSATRETKRSRRGLCPPHRDEVTNVRAQRLDQSSMRFGVSFYV